MAEKKKATTPQNDPLQRPLKTRGNINKLLAPNTERRQDMAGFEDDYIDFVDFIVRITHRIWEQGDMGYIYDTYQHNVVVHTAFGMSYGVEDVVSGSIAFLAGFPDRRLIAEDVIWKGNDKEGFYSSHLISNLATNLGYSPWSAPTSKKVHYLP